MQIDSIKSDLLELSTDYPSDAQIILHSVTDVQAKTTQHDANEPHAFVVTTITITTRQGEVCLKLFGTPDTMPIIETRPVEQPDPANAETQIMEAVTG